MKVEVAVYDTDAILDDRVFILKVDHRALTANAEEFQALHDLMRLALKRGLASATLVQETHE